MMHFIASFGFYLYPILLVSVAILVLTVISVLRLLRWRQRPEERTEAGINAILFWGVVCAVLGFLSQWTGIYKSMMALREAAVVNPAMVATGIAESLQTAILGLGILLIAALIWLALSSVHRRLMATESQSHLAAEST
jgi:biopolymer transport protein ExbB/TolQ